MTDVKAINSRRNSETNSEASTPPKPVIKNQRRTSFTTNALIPDLNIFSDGPGAGKYARRTSVGLNQDITLNSNPAYSIPKAERNINLSHSVDSTPGHYNIVVREKIPGHYLSSDKSDRIKNQRRTSFCDNTQVFGLNIFTETPGVGHYTVTNSFGKPVLESHLTNHPAYSIPKAERVIHKIKEENNPGVGKYDINKVKEKIPGHYSLGGRSQTKLSFGEKTEKTPGPTDYYPELAKDSIKKATPAARMPTARRFSNNFF